MQTDIIQNSVSTLVLRDYQQIGVKAIFDYFHQGGQGNPVVAMPTGTGKSLVIAGFITEALRLYSNQRILVLTHVKELIEQNFQKLEQYWPLAPAGVYSSGLKRKDIYNNVIFAGIASIVKNVELFGKFDLILIDECHLLSPNDSTMYQKVIGHFKLLNPFLKVIGFTATPYRLGQGMLIEPGSIFTDICCDMTTMDYFNWFVDQGYLSPLIPKRTKLELDVDGVGKRGGEYIETQLQHAVDKHEITEAAIKEMIAAGEDRNSWLIFGTGVEHSHNICDILQDHGISSRVVHGNHKKYKMPDKVRDKNIRDFKASEYTALVNANMLTTGFDHPLIDLLGILRPMCSPGYWVQVLGRGTRPVYERGYDLTTQQGRLDAISEGAKQNCVVMDFAENTKRLGPINDPVKPLPPGKRKRKGSAPVKECENYVDGEPCGTYNHASARFCVDCGHEFHFEVKIKMQASEEELIKKREPKEAPMVEVFKVNKITYSEHKKRGKTPSLKVTYYCGFKFFTEYVCLQHEGTIQHKAKGWWRKRSTSGPPATIEKALFLTDTLSPSTHIRVWTNKEYPQIMDHCFNGSAFGEQVENLEDLPKTNTAI